MLGEAVRAVLPGTFVAGVAEWESFAAACLLARMEDAALEPAPVWCGDLADLDGRPFRGLVDILAAGLPCFAAGTVVLSERGFTPIETVRVGDQVLTHKGRWRPVTAVMEHPGASLVRIKAQGVDVVTTPEHPFLARTRFSRWNNARRAGERAWRDEAWKPAGELNRKEFVCQVLPEADGGNGKPRELWWLAGRYLADGWRSKQGSTVTICAGRHKSAALADAIRRAGYDARPVHERTCDKYHICDRALHEWLDPFGDYAHGKRLPGFVFHLDADSARALMDGWLSGDGHRCANRKPAFMQWIGDTVSKPLAFGFALLAQRAFGTVASVGLHKSRGQTTIEGRTVNQRDLWRVTIPDHNRSGLVDGLRAWKQVRSVAAAGTGTVFNIAVAEDESYIADGAVVHNCQPYSVAGKQLGNADHRSFGDGDGPMPHALRLIAEMRPALVFLENVPAWVRGGWFRPFGEQLCGLGYEISDPIFLAADDVGATHQRERVFLLAHDPGQRGVVRRVSAHARRHEDSDADGRGAELADAGSQRLQGVGGAGPAPRPARRTRGEVGDPARGQDDLGRPGDMAESERCGGRGDAPAGHAGGDGDGLTLFAPGPKDPRWHGIISAHPHLAPALEPGVRVLSSGLSLVVDQARADQLRCIGNGVVPLQAAVALAELLRGLNSAE